MAKYIKQVNYRDSLDQYRAIKLAAGKVKETRGNFIREAVKERLDKVLGEGWDK